MMNEIFVPEVPNGLTIKPDSSSMRVRPDTLNQRATHKKLKLAKQVSRTISTKDSSSISVGQNSVVSINQQGGVTAGTININSSIPRSNST